jgi:short-subunit dehydrogenase
MTKRVQLKPISSQTIVLTGATSGIGLVTSREAASRGANVVLFSRNEQALAELTREIQGKGGHATYVAGDVANESHVKRLADHALSYLGGFDTWVNNAGVSIYGTIEQVSLEDHRRLFETNFWGVVHGSRIAAEHLRRRGGALINVGSTLSDRAIPLQGMYCASKFAVRGFTDALRMELEHDNAPISVTLVKPAAIDTPYTEHAKNYMGVEPMNPPPVYAPEVVAEAILYAAEHPVRDIFAGGAGKAFSSFEKYAPRLTDRFMEATLFNIQKTDEPAQNRNGAGLYEAGVGLKERGRYTGHVAESSVYTRATMHPWLTGAILGAAGVAVAAVMGSRQKAAR